MKLEDYEYYRTELGVLYNGDCNKILPLINNVDLTISDVPYGMNYHSNRYKEKNPMIHPTNTDKNPIELI